MTPPRVAWVKRLSHDHTSDLAGWVGSGRGGGARQISVNTKPTSKQTPEVEVTRGDWDQIPTSDTSEMRSVDSEFGSTWLQNKQREKKEKKTLILASFVFKKD